MDFDKDSGLVFRASSGAVATFWADSETTSLPWSKSAEIRKKANKGFIRSRDIFLP